MSRTKPDWTAEQLAEFDQMFLAGEHMQEMANELGAPLDRVSKLARSMPMQKWDVRHRAVKMLARAGKQRPVSTTSRWEPSAALLADRDRRYHAQRTITAELFGDPRPGQSALDKRASA